MFALKNSGEQIVQYLLNNGASIHAANNQGWTVPMFSLENKKFNIISSLEEMGVNFDSAKLMYFASRDNLSSIKKLKAAKFEKLDTGLADWSALVNATTPGGWTALMHAAAKNGGKVVKFLVDEGANIHVVNSHGCTAPMLAIAHNISSMPNPVWREKYADLEVATLMVAARAGDFVAAKKLENAGGGIYAFNTIPKVGITWSFPTTEAGADEDPDIFMQLQIQMKDKVDMSFTREDPSSWTVLMHAVPQDHRSFAEDFIEDFIDEIKYSSVELVGGRASKLQFCPDLDKAEPTPDLAML